MNDLVLRYWLREIRDSAGDVTMLRGEFQMMARGAGYDSAVGLHFPGLAPQALLQA
jgi:LruC domain-containing protein